MGKINCNPPKRRRVGLIFDERMCKHNTPDEEYHPENPSRIRAIWVKLHNSGLVQRCIVLNAKKAEDNQLALVHSKSHIEMIKTISSSEFVPKIDKIASKYDSIYFNGGSSEAASLAAGSVIEAAVKVAQGELDSAFAIVRPPGHHAEEDKPMGFCLYNNVAIATSFLLNERPDLGIGKILIVDWDVHHGNSTQKMFYKDPRVLFFSVHRHENGTFYSYGNDGSHIMTGEGLGAGYNINIPWENGWCGDSDYLAVWDHILIPVAKKFDPDMIFISAGFDAAISDPFGGCRVSADGYSIMLDKLMDFARGKIVMALEGGYNPSSLVHSVQACFEVLLQEKARIISLKEYPLESTWSMIKTVRQALCAYWPVLAGEVVNRRTSLVKIEIGRGHAINHTSDLQANTEVDKGHSADKEVQLKGKVNSIDEQKRERCPTSQAQPVGVDRTGPESSPATQPSQDSVSAQAANISKAPPSAASSTPSKQANLLCSIDDPNMSFLADIPSKRARLNVPAGTSWSGQDGPQIPLSSSLKNKVQSLLADDDFTWDRETVQRLASEENLDTLKEMSIDELTHVASTSFVDVLNVMRLMSRQGQHHEGRAIELAEKLKASEDENKKLLAACDRAEKSLDHEITTGEKFLKSKAGNQRINEAKKDGVDEYKASEAFHNEVLNAAQNVYDQAMKACRQMAFPR